jgi:hypothetical protein
MLEPWLLKLYDFCHNLPSLLLKDNDSTAPGLVQSVQRQASQKPIKWTLSPKSI